MRYLKSSSFVKFSAMIAALALQGSVLAATPAAAASTSVTSSSASVQQDAATASPDKRMGHAHKAMRGHFRHSAMWVPGYGPVGASLVESLALNASQTQLLKDAQTTQKELRETRRDSTRSARQARAEQLKSGKMDPRAELKQAATGRQQMVNERQEVEQKWLAVWDALDTAQQGKIATYFVQRAEKRAAHANKRAHDSDAFKDGKSAS